MTHAAVSEWRVYQVVALDRHPNTFTSVVDVRTPQQLAAHRELPNKVQFQLSIKAHEHIYLQDRLLDGQESAIAVCTLGHRHAAAIVQSFRSEVR